MIKVLDFNLALKEKAIFGIFSIASLAVILLGFFIIPAIYPDSTHADDIFPPVTDPSISIAPTTDINLPLTPIAGETGSFSTAFAMVTISTTNTTGYTFTMNTETTNTDLLNSRINYNQAGEADYKITSITTTTASSNFAPNKWGYNVNKAGTYIKGSAGTFVPIPNSESSDADRQIEVTDAPGSNAYTFNYGLRANNNLPAGDYQNTLVFSATANEVPILMQDFDYAACQNLNTDETVTLMDSRDNTRYTVAKLQDGNCWMTQNLELGEYGTSMNLASDTSNVSSSGYTLTFDYANNSIYKGNSNKRGNYYNWSQATAGSGTTTAGEDAPYDICPKGWRLPSTGASATDSEFYIMLNHYISGATWNSDYWNSVTTTQFTNAPISLVFSGSMNSNGALDSQGSNGRWWSSTSDGATNAFRLYVSTSGYVYPKRNSGQANGFPVRCLAKGPTLYDKVAEMSKGTQTTADIQTAITTPTSADRTQDTSNSGVYEYNSSVFGASSDASNDYKIYYYRGVLENSVGSYGSDGSAVTYPNYVKLGNTCWRIVRTTGSGGVKMIYNGAYGATTSGSCANTQTNAQVTTQAFGLQGNSAESTYWYRNINRVGYTFNNTQSLQDNTTSTSVDTVFGSDSNPATNNARSNIKTYIEDTWYPSAIGASSGHDYTNKLEASAGYCNDRTAYTDTAGASSMSSIPPYATSSAAMFFGSRTRVGTAGNKPTLTCPRSTVDLYRYVANSQGLSNELKYPAALITADEAAFAGSGYSASTTPYHANSYLRSGLRFSLLSPSSRENSGGYARGFSLYSSGYIDYYNVNSANGVRPAISLTSGTTATSGTGTATDPWIVDP